MRVGAIASPRWYVKKAARGGMALGSLLTGALAAQALASPAPRVRVLTYHRIGRLRHDPFCVTPEAFEAQIAWLARKRLALSLDEVERFSRGDASAGRKNGVLVTIDDGFVSTFTEARPILARYGVPAVAFVTAGFVANEEAARHHPERYMTAAELRALPDANIAVGSHALTHRSLGEMSREEVREEAARSKAILEEHVGRPVTSFAYPFGTRRDFTDETDAILAACGYTTIFNSQHGAVRAGGAATSLPRVKVEGGEGLPFFRVLCRGGMDGWRAVDHLLWRLQRVR